MFLNLMILEQISLIYCGIRKNADITVKTNKKYDSTIVQNMSGTTITFHPVNKGTYFIGTNVGYLIQVGIYLYFNKKCRLCTS